MNTINYSLLYLLASLLVLTRCDQSAVEVVQDIYNTCLKDFSISCVKPKALHWMDEASRNNVIRITEDLSLQKKYNPEVEEGKGEKDILEKFEDFLQSHTVVAKAPALLRPDGPLKEYIPRTFQATQASVPLAATGRSSKLIKRIIFPFLLGLKFKAALIIPFALALIALKTWKALTLGLLSLVLTGAISIFSKLLAPKVPAYEVVHHPHHIDHHVGYHHIDVLPAPAVPAVPVGAPLYVARNLGQNLAYSAHRK
ncbi:uncharacterized protein LOC130891502 [Diorhabda carinulata]|uniref:uncharacterized protein LOC130891502 n=1 Tax=Diorhabda carinulata TaxID=1163345 RepID=UPI0025A07CFD|nr:uncharacterized protein LOC130891502 [Diorhabda carinulata]